MPDDTGKNMMNDGGLKTDGSLLNTKVNAWIKLRNQIAPGTPVPTLIKGRVPYDGTIATGFTAGKNLNTEPGSSPDEKAQQIRDLIKKKDDVRKTGGLSIDAGPFGNVNFNVPRKRIQQLIKRGLKDYLPEGQETGPKGIRLGSVDGVRTIVAASEGFMIPTNYRVRINPPRGVDAVSGKLKQGGTEFEALKRNFSMGKEFIAALPGSIDVSSSLNYHSTQFEGTIQQMWQFATGGRGWDMGQGNEKETKIDLFCDTVMIPEKQIQFGLYRHYGAPTPHPTTVQYGTLSTSFYSDGVMFIKKFFDAWQKLIWNDVTGNFNFYNEYIGSMEIVTQKTVKLEKKQKESGPSGLNGFFGDIAAAAGVPGGEGKTATKFGSPRGFGQIAQEKIKSFTKSYEDMWSGGTPEAAHFTDSRRDVLATVQDTYGVKVFEIWPSIVGQVQMGHAMENQIGKIDVTWAYRTWDTFGLGTVSNRGGTIPLTVGEMRNEKDGFPFLEDLPAELGGPLTEAMNNGLLAIPIGKVTKGRLPFP